MSKLDLKVRNLETGEYLMATFDDEEHAKAFLEERPRMIEVLGVATHGLSRAAYAELKSASRPLDDDEKALKVAIETKEAEAARAQAMAEQAAEMAAQEAYKKSLRDADPNRPMGVRWTRSGGYEMMDPIDDREIPAVVREAVAAFVAERNEWVHSRGQIVDEVQVAVWPGPMPRGTTERVQAGGQFFTAPVPGTG